MTQLNQSDLLEYRTNLLQALEELKYKRTECKELHSRVEKLLTNSLQAEQNLEATTVKLKNAQKREEQLCQDLKQASATSSEEKWREENQKLREAVEAADKTVTGLKKELSMMSLTRHHLELNLKQAEQKVASRDQSTNAVIERLRSIEAATEKLSKQLEESKTAQTLLAKNVESSKSLNRGLERTCAHGNCLMNEYKRERDQLREKLLTQETKYRILQHNGQPDDKDKIIKKEIEDVKRELKYVTEQNNSKTQIIDKLRTKLVESENAAANAHKIAERSKGDDKNVIEIEKKLESSEKKCKDFENKHDKLLDQIEKQKRENATQVTELQTKSRIFEESAAEQIQKLQLKLDEANSRIEKANIELEKQNEIRKEIQELKVSFDSVENDKRIARGEVTKLTEEIETLKEELNKSKTEAESVKQLDCNDQESQTEVEVAPLNSTLNIQRKLATPTTILDLCSATEKKILTEKSENGEKSQDLDAVILPIGFTNMQEPENSEILAKVDPQISEKNISKISEDASPIRHTTNKDTSKATLSEPLVAENIKLSSLNDCAIKLPCPVAQEIIQKTFPGLRESQSSLEDVCKKNTEELQDSDSFDPKKRSIIIEKNLTDLVAGLNSPTLVNKAFSRNLSKKRKLSSTPPMLDASQCTQKENPRDSDFYSKQASLKSLKNFTKQVLSNKPHPRQPPNRFKPLNITNEASLDDENAFDLDGLNRKPKTPIFDPIPNNRPYTDSSDFAKQYSLLKDRLASRFGGSVIKQTPELTSGSNRFPVGTSGSISMGFRSKRQDIVGIVPASDEDEAMIEVSESDDSI